MKENLIKLLPGRMHIQPAKTYNDKKYFTFEGRLYYAVYNPPDYIGLMIFTGGGMAVQEYQFPELWMYYKYQKDFLKVKDQAFSK